MMHLPFQAITRQRIALLVVFGLILLAKGPAFLSPLYSVDAWIAASASDDRKFFNDLTLVLSQYRFGLAALFTIFRLFEFDAVPVAYSSVFLACGFTALASLFSYLVIDPEGRRTPYLIFATIFCLHPFTAEIFTFVDVTLFVSVSLITGLLGSLLLCRGEGLRDWVTGAGLVIVSLSIYQIALHYIIITLLLAGVASLMRGESLRPIFRALAIVLLSAFVCLLIGKAINAILQIPSEGRGSLIGLSEIPGRIRALWSALIRAFYPPGRLVPLAMSVVLGLALLLASFTSLWAVFRRNGTLVTLLAALAIGGAAFWVAGLSIAGKSVWLVPRVLSAVAVFSGGVMALGWLGAPSSLRRAMIVVTGLLSFGYVASNNRILFDQWRVNRWDAQQSNRILTRLEALPEFSQMKRLAIQGGFYSYPAALPTAFADLNMSSLAPGLFKNHTIRQTTGYSFAAPSQEEAKIATEYCQSAPKWPAMQSVRIVGELGIVCLGR